MAFDYTKINLSVPKYNADQIIGVTSGSFTVPVAPSFSTSTASQPFDTHFNDTCLFQGIFSVDGGASWNDFGVYKPNLTTAGQPVLQTVSCFGYVSATGVFTATAVNWYDIVHSSTSAYTVQYKVVFFAKDTQGVITPLATNEKLSYKSSQNYHKIFLAGTFPSSISVPTPITYNLGYIPKVRAWFVPTSSTSGSEGKFVVPAGALTTLDIFYAQTTVTLDTAKAAFSPVVDNTLSGIAGTMHYRVYLDG